MRHNLQMLHAPIEVRFEAVIELPMPECTTSVEPKEFFEENALLQLLGR